MILFDNKNIAIFFSQKSDGDMLFKQSRIGADNTPRQDSGQARINAEKLNEKIRQNRISFFKKHEINPARLVNLAGVHGTKIETITRDSILGSGALDANTRIPNADGLITNIKNSYLMITGADCFPVFFYDGKKGVIATAHAGWRGVIKEIIKETILKLRNSFDSDPADINVWIGPGIKSCHYSVPKERAGLFFSLREITHRVTKNHKNHIIERGGQIFLDLPGIIKSQLLESGVNPQKITEHPDCTFCETDKSRAYRGKDKYFSYRRDHPKIIEANAFIIHLK